MTIQKGANNLKVNNVAAVPCGFLLAIFFSKQALCIISEDFSVCRMFWLVALKGQEKTW